MRVVLAAAAVLAAALAPAAPAGAGGGLPTDDGKAVTLRIEPLELGEGVLRGVRLTRAWRLSAPDPDFGGVSGLLVEDGAVAAVGDTGWWITGRRGPDGLAPEIRMAPMRGADGGRFGKTVGDAEGLTRRGGRLVVSFERDHRIAAHVGGGAIGRTVRDRAMERLPGNTGMEALATLPDGRLIAIGEGGEDGFPVFVVDRKGRVATSRLPRIDRHETTGADVGPDGALYLLQRDFSVLAGLSIRVLRYRLGDDGLPDPRTAETLAAWESASGIDNMEGLAAFRDAPGGPVRLWLVSDDNFNAIQRTILVELEVE